MTDEKSKGKVKFAIELDSRHLSVEECRAAGIPSAQFKTRGGRISPAHARRFWDALNYDMDQTFAPLIKGQRVHILCRDSDEEDTGGIARGSLRWESVDVTGETTAQQLPDGEPMEPDDEVVVRYDDGVKATYRRSEVYTYEEAVYMALPPVPRPTTP